MALHCEDSKLSYGELNAASNRLAHFIIGKGLKKGAIVAILLDNSAESLIAILGILKAGCAFLPLDPNYPIDRLAYVVTESGCRLLVSSGDHLRLINALQWDCDLLKFVVCLDSWSFAQEIEQAGDKMNADLWNHVAESAGDDIAAGGWRSAYNNELFSREEMDEYAENVYLKLKTVINPSARVLEIGCASGLTLFRLAPSVLKYTGIDISSKTISKTRDAVRLSGLNNVELHTLGAHELGMLGDEKYDLIILNSVVQNFSGLNYLRKVIAKCVSLLRPEGKIFLGDILDNTKKSALLEEFRNYFLSHHAKSATKTDWSEDLFVPREFLLDLMFDVPQVSSVSFSEKIGTIENELTKFRYDAILHTSPEVKDSTRSRCKFQFDLNDIAACCSEDPQLFLESGDLSYVLYTSGSTGRPKGVEVNHGSILNYVDWFCDRFQISADDSSVLLSKITFDGVYTSIWGTLLRGGRLRILAKDRLLDPMAVSEAICKDQISFLKTTPTLFHMILKAGTPLSRMAAPKLRLVVIGGEAIRPADVKHFLSERQDVVIINHYGPTEATIGVIYHEIDPLEIDEFVKKPVIGTPITGCRVYILDQNFMPVPENVPGEIFIGGKCLAKGYLNNDMLTKASFIKDPFSAYDSEVIYRTGDMGRWVSGGVVELAGRKDEQIKIRGYRIEIKEIEEAVRSFPGLLDVTIVPAPDEDGIPFLTAYIIGENLLNEELLRVSLRKMLPDYMIPAYFVQLDHFPMTTSGKIERLMLPSPKGKETAGEQPLPGVEADLAKLWCEVLGRNSVNADSNFFEIGGHSLKAARLLARIYKAFGVELKYREIFEFPLLRSMASQIGKMDAGTFKTIEPVIHQELYECSHSQRRLWILDQISDNKSLYNTTGVHQIKGPLNCKAFQEAFEGVIDRHEILRTVFVTDMGEPFQKILTRESSGFTWLEIDLRREKNIRRICNEIVTAETNTPFDLRKGPLVRTRLLRLAEEEYLFIIAFHHIVCDAWSMEVMMKEISGLYRMKVGGEDTVIPPLRIQYKDFVLWQKRKLDETANTLRETRSFWLDLLHGELPVLNLSLDRSRPERRSGKGARLYFEVGGELFGKIKARASEANVSRFMYVLSSVVSLLHRYTGDEDIIVGTTVAGREHSDLENLIGFFVNTIPIRTRLSASESFSHLLERVKHVLLQAQAHQSYPFDKLVDDLNIANDRSRMPVFDVMVEYFAGTGLLAGEKQMYPGLLISDVDNPEVTSKFDITFGFKEVGDRLELQIEYNTDIFEEAGMSQMGRHLLTILNGCGDDPDCPIGKMNILSDDERHQLLVAFNSNQAFLEDDKTVVDLFKDALSVRAGKTAVRCGHRSVSYEELDRLSDRLAWDLADKGIQPGDFVCIFMERGIEFMIAILAIFKAGAAYVPVDMTYPGDRIILIVEDTMSKLILTSPRSLNDLPLSVQALSFEIDVSGLKQYLGEQNSFPSLATSRSLAYMIYTSGSTGKPKGVMIEHLGMLNHLFAKISDLEIDENSIVGQTASCSFDISVWQMWSALCAGGTTVIYDDEVVKSPSVLLERLAADKISIWEVVPSFLSSIAPLIDKAMLPQLKYLVVTGEDVKQALIQRWFQFHSSAKVVNAYGPTEASDDICHHVMEEPPPGEFVPIGKPVQNLRIYVVDVSYNLQPIGVAGELYVSGPGVGRGYWNDAVRTQQSFFRNQFQAEGHSVWYKTGDLAKWNKDGTLQFLGRKDQQVKLRGNRIEIGEIELAIDSIDGIRSSVVELKGGDTDKCLVGYYIADRKLDQTFIRRSLLGRLPAVMVPDYFVELSEFPRLTNGKIDRHGLPAPERERKLDRTGHSVKLNIIEYRLLEIWRDVLGSVEIGPDNDFFSVGGNSLSALKIISKAESELHIRLTLKMIFDFPTVSAIAAQVRLSAAPVDQLTSELSSKDALYPASPIQRQFWILSQLEAASCAYNVCTCVKISGPLDLSLLSQAFSILIGRHEILRTHFIVKDDAVMQEVYHADLSGFSVMPIGGVSVEGQKSETEMVSAVIDKERATPFSFEKFQPLFRARILAHGKETAYLFFSIHHIICDATSLSIIFKELANAYASLQVGEAPALTQLRSQYGTYVKWLNSVHAGRHFEEGRLFWKKQFADDVPVLRIPTDFPVKARQTFDGDTMNFTLPAELVSGIRSYAAAESVSVFSVLFTSVNLLLHNYSQQDDIIVGTTVSTRWGAGTEEQIGPYINTLPVRTRFNKFQTFNSLLSTTARNLASIFEFADYPVDVLAGELDIEPQPGRSMMYDVIVGFRDISGNEQISNAGKVKFESTATSNRKAQFWLTIDFFENSDELAVVFNYNTDLFRTVSILLMWERLLTLITQIIQSPGTMLCEFDFDLSFAKGLSGSREQFDY